MTGQRGEAPPDGAALTARWLADHAAALAGLAAMHRRIAAVVVPLGDCADGPHRALADAASVHVRACVQPGAFMPGGLRGVLAAFGMHAGPDPVTELRAATSSACASMLVGQAGTVRQRVLLGAHPRRGERTAMDALDDAAALVAALAGRTASEPAGDTCQARGVR